MGPVARGPETSVDIRQLLRQGLVGGDALSVPRVAMLRAVLLAGVTALATVSPVVGADPSLTPSPTPTPAALPDLGPVVIVAGDLPDGFAPSDANVDSFTSLAHALAGGIRDSPGAGDHNALVLERRTESGAEFVTAVLIGPLAADDQAAFDATVQQADRLVDEAVAATMGDAEVEMITGMRTGVSRFAVAIHMPDVGVEYRAVAARRGPVLAVVGHAWTEGVEPVTSLAEVAGILDARLAAAVGSEAPVYRPSGPLVPVITTHIPTPLDVSTDPAVVGTNLLLAALALLLLTISSKVASSLLAQHEAAIAARVPGVGMLGRLEARIGRVTTGRIRRRRLRDIAALIGVTMFYGVVFSLLEPGWEPLTITGLWLLVSFTVANGLVGVGDDVVAWAVARRWGVAASLSVRPTTLLLAAGSVGVSRVAAVVPGLMFGTPEALRLDDTELGAARARRLAVIGVAALAAVGGVAWAITMVTTALARDGGLANGLAGIEAMLLLVFASALQNLFVALVGFRGSAGDMLRQRSRVAWLLATSGATFLFFHTLLNPQGDPAAALANRNVQVTMGLVLAFSMVTGVAWLFDRVASAPGTREAERQHPSSPPTPITPQATITQQAMLTPPAPSGPVAPPFAPGLVHQASVAMAFPGQLPAAVPWVSIRTADGAARGRVWLAVADGVVTARTELLDPAARHQYWALVLLSGAGILVPAIAGAALAPGGSVPDGLAVGLLAMFGAWGLVVVAGRVWLERYRVVHTAVFPVREVAAVQVGRDLGLGCVLAILLSPLIGLLYLAVTGGRVTRITAPFDPGRPGPVRVRCKGSEAEAWSIRHLLLGVP